MTRDIATQIKELSHTELCPIISGILGKDATPLGQPAVNKIGRSAGHATAGIFRVAGRAQTVAGETEWSAVVKALGIPENPSPGAEYDAFKEIEIYRARAFTDQKHGMRAANCYGIQDHGETMLLWLEDLSDAPQAPWEFNHFVAAANNIGQFNSSWSESEYTQWGWLSKQSFQARFQEPQFRQGLANLLSKQDHPLVQTFLPPSVTPAFTQMWDQVDELLAMTEETPTGVCHFDCHPKNLFPISDPQGGDYTVGIDWVKVGIGPLGVDIGHLLASPIIWHELTPEEVRNLIDPIYNSYVEGMAVYGKADDDNKVQLTYLTRIACEARRSVLLIFHAVHSAEWAATMERLLERPMQETCEQYCRALDVYFECTEKALRLAK